MVPGTHGIWAARAGQPLDSGGSARSRDERQGEQRGEIPGMVAAVCTVDEERSCGGISGKCDGFAVHDFDGASKTRETRNHSFRNARGWKRAAANSGERSKSAVLAVDRLVCEAHGRSSNHEHVVQFARRSDRAHADGCDSYIFQFRDGRAGDWKFCRGEMKWERRKAGLASYCCDTRYRSRD